MQKLPKKDHAILLEVISSGDFDSETAMNLDEALINAIPDFDYESCEGISEPLLRFFACWWVEGEVNNGGFHQFFLNKGPRVVRESLLAAREMGLETVVGLVRKALEAASTKGSVPESFEEMEHLMHGDGPAAEAFESKLNEIDDEFFDLEPYPPLLEARLRYVANHPGEFFKL